MVFADLLYYELLFYLGLSLFFGYLSSIVLERVGIPNVVVYLMTGFIVGNFFIPDLYETASLEYWYSFVEALALGLIGFKVGTEMHLGKMKEESFLLFMIILGQIFFSFMLVFIGAYLWTGQIIVSLIFGGLATASAPAATIEIIRKFKASGPLTQRISWSLALIDVAAVIIVETILIFSSISLLGDNFSILPIFESIGTEIGYALVLGTVAGFVLDPILERLDDNLQMMEITLATLILTVGIADWIHASVIISTITVGAVTVNREGDNYEQAVDILEIAMSPILILFFVLVGSEIRLELFSPDVFPWFALVYLVLRAIGKVGGSFIGARLGNGSPEVQKYLGLGMLPQGGLVLGLITVAEHILTEAGRSDIGDLVVVSIIIATFFSEALGSFGAVYGLGKANELKPDLAQDNPIAAQALETKK